MLPSGDYNIYVCKVHNKTIYYFKTDKHITGKYHCWDCHHDEKKSLPSKGKDNGNV